MKAISSVLSDEKKTDTAKTYESVGELIKLLIDLFDSYKGRHHRTYGSFNLNSNGVEIMRLGRDIPQWLRNLCTDVISSFFDSQMAKKNFRLLFTKMDSD